MQNTFDFKEKSQNAFEVDLMPQVGYKSQSLLLTSNRVLLKSFHCSVCLKLLSLTVSDIFVEKFPPSFLPLAITSDGPIANIEIYQSNVIMSQKTVKRVATYK